MDRRQVLVGMTAMGVAGSLNLNELRSAQSGESATQNPTARYAYLSNGERPGMLGPVKTCIEERQNLLTTTEYGTDGKVVTIHMEEDGKPLYSSSELGLGGTGPPRAYLEAQLAKSRRRH